MTLEIFSNPLFSDQTISLNVHFPRYTIHSVISECKNQMVTGTPHIVPLTKSCGEHKMNPHTIEKVTYDWV